MLYIQLKKPHDDEVFLIQIPKNVVIQSQKIPFI